MVVGEAFILIKRENNQLTNAHAQSDKIKAHPTIYRLCINAYIHDSKNLISKEFPYKVVF